MFCSSAADGVGWLPPDILPKRLITGFWAIEACLLPILRQAHSGPLSHSTRRRGSPFPRRRCGLHHLADSEHCTSSFRPGHFTRYAMSAVLPDEETTCQGGTGAGATPWAS